MSSHQFLCHDGGACIDRPSKFRIVNQGVTADDLTQRKKIHENLHSSTPLGSSCHDSFLDKQKVVSFWHGLLAKGMSQLKWVKHSHTGPLLKKGGLIPYDDKKLNSQGCSCCF